VNVAAESGANMRHDHEDRRHRDRRVERPGEARLAGERAGLPPASRHRIRATSPKRTDALLLAFSVVSAAGLLTGTPGAIPLALALNMGIVVLAVLRLLPAPRPVETPVASAEIDAARLARERAEAESTEKSRLLATAGHEIRTPLHGIVGMADLLAETPLTPEQSAYVRAVRTSGTALLGLVDDVLDLTRVEAGRLAVTPEPIDLRALVEDVVELMAPRAHGKGLELASIVAPGLPERVEADPILLRQVLINLAGNAVKYTVRGGVAVEVEPADGPTSAGRIAFRVRDTGVGIAAADAERIFSEFERVASGDDPRGGGAGLGLAIARSIVERMGGSLRLASRPGEGSVFFFDLYLPAVETRAVAVPPLAGRRVALISDGVVEPPLLVRRLHALGAEAVLAVDPTALDPSERHDVVIIDGDDRAIENLADLRATGIDAPAVVAIAPTDRSRLADLRHAGFTGHLIKPVRAASLARVVAALGSGETIDEPVSAGRTPGAAAPTGLHLLLADDNEINALLGRALLENLGHRATVVADGAAAVAAVAEARDRGRPFAGVLMDLHMPGMDGFAAIRALRLAEAGDDHRLGIVALTADGTAAAAMRARAAGADAVLVKPIERERLAAVLAGFAASGLAAGA
jgi:signal transduction histidine kinase/DNA-binding NarL/FixJ family response regulator